MVFWPAFGNNLIEFRDLTSDCDVIWKNPRNYPPRAAAHLQPHANRSEFYDSFCGGWFLSLPGGFFPGDYFGAPLGVLGEFAVIPWELGEMTVKADEIMVTFIAEGRRTPFTVRRQVSLAAGSGEARFVTTVSNRSFRRLPVAWLEHLTLGGPLLEGGRLYLPAAQVRVPPADRPELSQLVADSVAPWPFARKVLGAMRDCSLVPSRGSDTEHVVMAENFLEGHGCLWNDRLQLGFQLRWDAGFFPLAWLWAAGNGGSGYPFWGGAHVMALEPSTSSLRPFPQLVERGEVVWIEPRSEVSTWLTAGFVRQAPREAT